MLDPRVYKDWQIAEEAEKSMPNPKQWQEKLGLTDEESLRKYCQIKFCTFNE